MNAEVPSDPNLAPPTDAAHAADVTSIREREAEEQFARQHSMPTRWLGWMLMAGFVLQLVGGLMHGTLDLGSVVFLAAGMMVGNGSQAALRFVISITSGSVLGIAVLIWKTLQMQPLTIGATAFFADDLKFWVFGVCPLGYLLAKFVLGIVVLRTRGLSFWTKTLRVWASIIGVMLLIAGGLNLHAWYQARSVERQMAAEIAAGRAYAASSRPGVFTSTTTPSPAMAAFSPYPQILRVSWREPSGARTQVYQCAPATPAVAGSPRKFSMWLRDSSGSWGELELELVVPDAP